MITRSKEIWLVAFFLSKFGNDEKGKNTQPPSELKVLTWNTAYRMFYDTLGQARTLLSFEHSLKNARDSYDSIIGYSTRTGWRDSTRNPKKLEKAAQKIFEEYSDAERKIIWNKIEKYTDNSSLISKIIVDDLISIQESETYTPTISRTEGRKKVIISHKYERNLKLRSAAFEIHGYNCMVCGFNFERFYGKWGKGFGEVHHLIPLSTYEQKNETDPKNDLIILCANCHRMVHRVKGITLTIKELKQKINHISLNAL